MAMSGSTKQTVRSMNPWVLHLQKMGLELKCPLCLNLLKRPFLLPCDHIFCNTCLLGSTQFGSECPVCKAQYVHRDLRPIPFIENMVAIYRSLDAAFCASLFQPTSSDAVGVLERRSTSINKDCNDKLSMESLKADWVDNSSGGRSTLSLLSKKVAVVPPNQSIDNGLQTNEIMNKCSVPIDVKEHEMVGSGVDGHDRKLNANLPSASFQTGAGGLKKCGTIQIDINEVDQMSPGSPPSFGEFKGSDNDSNDQCSDDDPQNYQTVKLAKRVSDDRTRQVRHGSSASGTEDGHLRDSKRLKKLNHGSSDMCAHGADHITPMISEIENSGTFNSQLELKLAVPLNGERHEFAEKIDCEFCQSSRISEDTGPLLHYVNGKQVEGGEATLPNAIHVHKICIEWAPQVYFVGERTVKNLKAELARSAKLKCSRCGLKGAALGCYLKSCRKSYHVPCALGITKCRWDDENFLLLCPSHSSLKFPNEKSKSKIHNLKQLPSPAEIVPQQSNFWKESTNEAKDWVFCGSALSSEEKSLLVEFGSMVGVPVTKSWKPNVTHVIAATDARGACTRTLKVLMAILNGRWVLSIAWVKACMESMHPVNEEPYEVSIDNYGCCDGPRTGRLRALDNAPKLFNGLSFYFVGDFLSSYKEDLRDLVITAGGRSWESEEDLMAHICEQADLSRTLVVYNLDPPQGCQLGEEVSIIWQRLSEAQDLAAKIGSQVVGHTWLLESIAAYKLQPFVS